MAQAANKAKTNDPQKVAEMIKSGGPWDTVLGPLSYDSKGDITKLDYVMYRWEKQPDGKITYVEMNQSM
jgi:branched-chain amino acid transport system substrate-binding protein